MEAGDVFGLIVLLAGSVSALGILAGMMSRRMVHRERMAEYEVAKLRAPPAAAPQAAKLEARLRVLERIATDKSGDLATSIERLRDPSLVD